MFSFQTAVERNLKVASCFDSTTVMVFVSCFYCEVHDGAGEHPTARGKLMALQAP